MAIWEVRQRLSFGLGRVALIGLAGLSFGASAAQAQLFGRSDEPVYIRRGFVRGPQAQYYVPQGMSVPRGAFITQGGVIVPVDGARRSSRGGDALSHKANEQLRKAPPPPPVKGPLLIAISIAEQKLTVYDDGVPIATSPVSTGTASHPTPMGVFAVIGKERFHRSNLYSAAPMPFMQRITWSGVALHAGVLPGYPASHGCIRLPNDFAIRLYHTTKMGARVIITQQPLSPTEIAHARLFAPKPKPPAEPAIVAVAPEPVTVAKSETKAEPAPAPVAKTIEPPVIVKVDEAVSETKTAEVVAKSSETPATETTQPVSESASTAPAAIIAAVEKTAEPAATPEQAAAKIDEPAAKAEEPRKEEVAAKVETPEVKAEETIAKTDAPAVKNEVVVAKVEAPDTKAEEVAVKTEPATPVIAKLADLRPAVVMPVVPRLLPARLRPGAVSAFVSRKEKRLYVRKGFEPLFDVPVEIANVDQPLGTHVFTLMELDGEKTRWSVVSMPADRLKSKKVAELEPRNGKRGKRSRTTVEVALADPPPPITAAEALDRVTLPQNAIDAITDLLSVGASFIITDKDRGPETGEETDFVVLTR